ncbi:site-specific DNA-methyltransferase [Citrobacter freundii]
MSRLTDLIAKTKAKDPQLGADLDREIKILSSRLPFGLNFERHSPEVVELPLRPVRKGDKVRILPERGSNKKGDQRLWQTKAIHKSIKTADLELLGAADVETRTVALSDLVVVAEFRDPIWPGLVSTGKVQRGGDKPFHSVINGENYHVLKALTYTHRGKIDAIYIDPPYNTGAKDWKYNNDYVEGDDLYRHSKWLAMMERRLIVAKELLNPESSVLIVTIDEKEYLRLGLLLEQLFPEAEIQMVTSVINRAGSQRAGRFSRVEEYIFYLYFGNAQVSLWTSTMLDDAAKLEGQKSLMPTVWFTAVRRGTPSALRGARPNLFYPIFLYADTGKLHSVGDPIGRDIDRSQITAPPGTIPMWPVHSDGTEQTWRFSADRMRQYFEAGTARLGRRDSVSGVRPVTYLQPGTLANIENGTFVVTGRNEEGALELSLADGASKLLAPRTVWSQSSHFARDHGSTLLKCLLGEKRFDFPKSLYAVEDTLRFVLLNNPQAIVLDFFSGSGTTAHAVMRLNKQDGGHRQCISVTNNEVAAEEQKRLREQGLRPGDSDWEKWGICDYITKPRVQAAITGKTPKGEPVKGSYKFTDEFPMSDGFEENAEFFTLTYEADKAVSHNLAYSRIAPLLWLRAGGRGKRIDKLPAEGWCVVDTYGLLSEVDKATPFIKAINDASNVRMAFIVTDDDRRFQSVARRLPNGVEPVRLYESYLSNFSFSNGELTE